MVIIGRVIAIVWAVTQMPRGFCMKNYQDEITVKLQLTLNKEMYRNNRIPYDLFSKVNDILISRLTYIHNDDTIKMSESKNVGGGKT